MLVALAAGAVLATASAGARANCAIPTTYAVTVAGSTVTICPRSYQDRGCPDPDGMLRASATETVRIADHCSSVGSREGCYVDECVPQGTYRYGFARPYDCCAYCCGTDYYATAVVTEAPPPDCGRSDAGAGSVAGGATDGPESVAPADWPSRVICDYGGGNAEPTVGAGSGCSCALAVGGSATKLVLGANGLLVLLGLLLGRQRRSA